MTTRTLSRKLHWCLLMVAQDLVRDKREEISNHLKHHVNNTPVEHLTQQLMTEGLITTRAGHPQRKYANEVWGHELELTPEGWEQLDHPPTEERDEHDRT